MIPETFFHGSRGALLLDGGAGDGALLRRRVARRGRGGSGESKRKKSKRSMPVVGAAPASALVRAPPTPEAVPRGDIVPDAGGRPGGGYSVVPEIGTTE